MNFRRSFAVTRRIFQGLRHDRRTLGLALFAPILVMLIFGTAFSGDVHDLDVIVVDGDDGMILNRTLLLAIGVSPEDLAFLDPAESSLVEAVDEHNVRIDLSRAIIAELEEGDELRVKTMSDSGDALDKVKDGEAWARISFPANFTRDVYGAALALQFPALNISGQAFGDSTDIEVRADESSVNVAAMIKKKLGEAVQDVMEQVGADLPMEIDDRQAVYGDNATVIDFFVPGIMALAVWLLTTMLTLLSFVGEKSTGTLERLQASPLTEGELVVGYAMAYGTLGMIQAGLLMTVATLVFGITIVGNPLYAFLVVAVLAVVSQNLGILMSSAARTEAQAVQMIPVVILPTFLLAGIFWPVEAIPSWLQPVSWAIPPTYAVEALRSVLLRGWGIERIVWPQLIALITFAVLFLGAAVALLRSRKK